MLLWQIVGSFEAGTKKVVGVSAQNRAQLGPFQVLDTAADSFLVELVNILDPPDTWVPSRLDLQPGE